MCHPEPWLPEISDPSADRDKKLISSYQSFNCRFTCPRIL